MPDLGAWKNYPVLSYKSVRKSNAIYRLLCDIDNRGPSVAMSAIFFTLQVKSRFSIRRRWDLEKKLDEGEALVASYAFGNSLR